MSKAPLMDGGSAAGGSWTAGAAGVFAAAKKVLIVQLSAIGDILRAASIIPALRKSYPGIRVGMLVYEEYAEVLAGIPNLTFRHAFPNLRLKEGFLKSRGDEESLKALYVHGYLPVEELHLRNYDVAVNFHFSTASAYLTSLSSAKYLLGTAVVPDGGIDVYGKEAFEVYDVLRNPDRRAAAKSHLAARYHRMCGLPESGVRLSYSVPSSPSPLPASGNFFAVHVGGGWSAKCWSGEKWRDLILRVHQEFGWQAVLLGTDFERDRVFKGGLAELPAVDLCGKPFMESAKALSRCKLFVGSDSGPMHLAGALDVPVVALFGQTSAAESYPLAGRNAVIRKPRMADIEAAEVLSAVSAVVDLNRKNLPTWDGAVQKWGEASQIYGAILFENPAPLDFAKQNVA